MDEATIISIGARQKALADELSKLKINISKDGPSRKTISYREEKLRKIEAIWSEFKANHQQIVGVTKQDTPYIQGDTIGRVEKLYLELKATLEAIAPDEEQDSKGEETNVPEAAGSSTQKETGTKPKPVKRLAQEPATDVPTDAIKLIRRQKLVAESLRRLINSLDEADTTTESKSFYELKIQGINKYWTQLEGLHQDLGELTQDPSTLGYDMREYIELEDKVQQLVIWLSTKLEAPSITYQQAPQSTSSMLQLPKISIPRFDGDYSKWRQFSDLYIQMVHRQPLSNCQKMWYLKTNLVGEAEKLLRHFSLSDDNYNAAWKMLQDRYENTRLLVASLVNKLLNQPGHASEQPSAIYIKALHDTTKECLLGLENLKVSTATWDPLLLHILYKKLDRSTHALYEQSLTSPKELQSIKEFLIFLEVRFQSLEALGNKGKRADEVKTQARSSTTLTSTITNKKQQMPTGCIACNGNHFLYQCSKFLQMNAASRSQLVSQEKLCKNCLRKGHYASNCSLRGCKKCLEKHNTLLHYGDIQPYCATSNANTKSFQRPAQSNSAASSIQKPAEPTSALTTTANHTKEKFIILGTARVKLLNNIGTEIECRALLDSGSQINLISDRAVKRLGLTSSSTNMLIQGIGQGQRKSQKRVNVILSSTRNAFSTRLEAFVLSNIIPPQPSKKLDISSWSIPHNIQLADPAFHDPDHIDVLLGTELFFQLLSIGQINLGVNLPTLQNTVFGWIVAGGVEQPAPKLATCGMCSGEEEDINITISRFWDIEQPEEVKVKGLTIGDQRCETYFEQTCKRDSHGRFVVSLPFSDDPKTLGQSKDIAFRRFLSNERRLMRQPKLRQQYTDFMEEYQKLGHMQEVSSSSIPSSNCFLPHHCVLKPDSSSTKLRVVFDASAKTTTNISLNNILHTGPVLQEELFTILLRFRLPRFVFTADIEKMYRQINVNDKDRNYQLIWWRSDQGQQLRCYQLNTVTYGTSAAPYLAIKCLQRLAQDEGAKYPLEADCSTT